jgi:hypothetical protein
MLGHALWDGVIYAPNPRLLLGARDRVYYGVWGSAAFQHVYKGHAGGVLGYLPRTVEWYFTIALCLAASLVYRGFLVPAAFALGYSCIYFGSLAAVANLRGILPSGKNTRTRRFATRAIIFVLHAIEPAARYFGRFRAGLVPWRGIRSDRGRGGTADFNIRVWPAGSAEIQESVDGPIDKFAMLRCLTDDLKRSGCAVHWNPETASWDMRVRRGMLALATARLHVSQYGVRKFSVRFRFRVRPPALFAVCLVSLLSLAAAAALRQEWPAAIILASVATAGFALSVREVGRIGYAITQSVRRLIPRPNVGERVSEDNEIMINPIRMLIDRLRASYLRWRGRRKAKEEQNTYPLY